MFSALKSTEFYRCFGRRKVRGKRNVVFVSRLRKLRSLKETRYL